MIGFHITRVNRHTCVKFQLDQGAIISLGRILNEFDIKNAHYLKIMKRIWFLYLKMKVTGSKMIAYVEKQFDNNLKLKLYLALFFNRFRFIF